MRTILACVVALMFIGVPSAWSAPTLVFDGLELAGADNVSVDGNLFDVRFLDGTCADVFSGCDSVFDFAFWNDEASATSASQALSTDVFIPLYDEFPASTRGCESIVNCFILTPYFIVNGNIHTVGFFNGTTEFIDDIVTALPFQVGSDLTDFTNRVYADWTLTQPIPAPSTSILLISGLLGLAGYRWLQRRGERAHVG